MSLRQASMYNSVPNTLVADASAGLTPLSTPHAIFQLMSLRNSTLACTSARLSWTHSWSITRRPSGSLECCAHSWTWRSEWETPAEEHSATRSRLSWPVISFHPSFSGPMRLPIGSFSSLFNVWLVVAPETVGTGVQRNPAALVGTTRTDRPL